MVPNRCSKTLEIKPGQTEATDVIWRVYSGIANDQSRVAPIVEWYEGDKLDCPGNASFWGYTVLGPGHQERGCLLGEYIPSMHLAIVAYRQGQSMSDTALAHELCHAYFKAGHEVCKDDGSANDPVTYAKRTLKVMGL